MGIEARWQLTKNQGKRHGQMTARDALTRQPDILITMDTDGELDPYAIEEILKPFCNPEVQSVAGVVLATNAQVNLLARFTDNLFVTGQLTDRSALSTLSSALVNCGGLAAYRDAIFEDEGNKELYLNEKFGNTPIQFSDDSMATLFAKVRGKTVQQRSAMVFSAMPQNLRHHKDQQLRWMRGSFIRSFWRLRELPVLSPGFIRQVVSWAQILVSTYVFAMLLVIFPLQGHGVPWEIVAIPVAVSYLQAMRYWTFKRSEMSFGSQLLNFLLAPVAMLWNFSVMRVWRFYAWATCHRNKWNTRNKVEVHALPAVSLAVQQLNAAQPDSARHRMPTRKAEEV